MSIDVIVAYAVGESSQENGWALLCALVHNMDESAALDVLKNTEQQFKEKFNKPLPSAYRSAKSTALKARRLAISLMDDAGMPKGKTAVSKECSAAMPKEVRSRSIPYLVDELNDALSRLDGSELAAYIMYIQTNLKGL